MKRQKRNVKEWIKDIGRGRRSSKHLVRNLRRRRERGMGQETIFEEIIIEISRINKNRNPWIQEYYQIPSKIKKKKKEKEGEENYT